MALESVPWLNRMSQEGRIVCHDKLGIRNYVITEAQRDVSVGYGPYPYGPHVEMSPEDPVLPRGTLLAQIPLAESLTIYTISETVSSLLRTQDPDMTKDIEFTLAFLLEKSIGKESRFYEYLALMPDADVPLLWTPEEKAMLNGTSVELYLDAAAKVPIIGRLTHIQ